MSRQASILIPTSGTGNLINVAALGTSTADSIRTLGKNSIFALSSDQDLMLTVGMSTNIVTPTSAVGFRVPANQVVTMDLGVASDSLQVFNLSASTTAHVTIMKLAVE
jgi:hypothetical protein